MVTRSSTPGEGDGVRVGLGVASEVAASEGVGVVGEEITEGGCA